MSVFANIVGNEDTKRYLETMMANGRMGNSFVFSGCEGIGKSLFARALARWILTRDDPQGVHGYKLDHGVHPDLHELRPEGKVAMHTIDAMRRLSEEVYRSPSEAQSQVFIIHDADRMLPTSANALLKTFEEPSRGTYLFLLTSNPQALLPTVLSRCRRVGFRPVTEEAIRSLLVAHHGCAQPEAARLARMAQGSVGRATRLYKGEQSVPLDSVLSLLRAGKVGSYKELGEALDAIHEPFEAFKEQLETSMREQSSELFQGDLSASQKEAIQKELDGAVAIRYREEVQALLLTILGWYRDLTLLQAGGDSRWLTNHESLLKGIPIPIEKVQEAIVQVKVGVERSTPLRSCLESLFLRLGYL